MSRDQHMVRFEPDETVTSVAGWSREGDDQPVGWRMPVKAVELSPVVLRTGRPARIDSYADVPGPDAALARQLGIRSSVGCPITVEGRLWGLTTVSSRRPEPLPADTEGVAGFTELVATAIANTQACGGRLRLSVADDGTGGADPARGSGLVGLSDRVQALGGTLTVHSLAGAGTTLVVDLPSRSTAADRQPRTSSGHMENDICRPPSRPAVAGCGLTTRWEDDTGRGCWDGRRALRSWA